MKKFYNLLEIILFLCILIPETIMGMGRDAKSSIIIKDTIWTKASSPYKIDKDIFIEKDAVLTIEPGVKIIFIKTSENNKPKLIVRGALIARGEKDNNITFTSDYPISGTWGGIIFEGVINTKSEISFCRIEYASCGIGCFNSSLDINNNTFNSNEVAIVCEDRASPVISNNFFTENGTFRSIPGGISCALYSDPKIINNTIEKNKGYGICASTFSRPIISNNIIREVWGRGIVIFTNAMPVITNNEIYGNTAFGIVSFQSSPTIISNNIYKNLSSGIIILLGGSPLINNNLIHQNGTGITCIESSPSIIYNVIKDNDNSEIALWDNSTPLINFNHIKFKEGHPTISLGRIGKIINLNNNFWEITSKEIIGKSFKSLIEGENIMEKVNYSDFLTHEVSAYESSAQITPNNYTAPQNIPWQIYKDKILFNSFRDNNWEIYATNFGGTELKNLTNNPFSHDVYPIFSPDGKNIVFSSNKNGNMDISILRLGNRSITQLTDTLTNEEFPCWSPDGKKIAFNQLENFSLYFTIDPDSKNRTRTLNAPEGYHATLFLWVPVN